MAPTIVCFRPRREALGAKAKPSKFRPGDTHMKLVSTKQCLVDLSCKKNNETRTHTAVALEFTKNISCPLSMAPVLTELPG